MKSAVETLNPTRVKLTVEVPFDELRPDLDAAYRKIARQIRVKGFRPGKVPPPLIDRQVGRGVILEEAVNEALPRLYGEAVREHEVRPLGHPEVSVTDFADGSQLVFTAEVDVRPPVELPAYDSLEVTVDSVEPTDEEVDQQLDGMRDRFATLSTVERAVQDGDYVTIDVAATVDGTALEDLSATGLSYQVGSGRLVAGLDEAVTGLPAGGEATFDTQLDDGRNASVTVTVRSVKEKDLPRLDDEFAQTASEFDTLDELRADLRTRLSRVKRLTQGGQARDRVLEKLLSLVDIPTPEHVLGDEVGARRRSFDEQLERAGLSMQAYLEGEGRTEEDFAKELEDSAREAIKSQLILDEVARREELAVSEAELSDQVVRRAARVGMSADDYAKELVAHGQVQLLMAELLRGKALAFVLEHAKITDSEGRPVDLDELSSATV
jgi:trigger factor